MSCSDELWRMVGFSHMLRTLMSKETKEPEGIPGEPPSSVPFMSHFIRNFNLNIKY